MFSTDFILRQQENLVDNQNSQAGYRPLRNKILLFSFITCTQEGPPVSWSKNSENQ